MPENSTLTLSPHYYLDNFHLLCSSVDKQYGDVLNDEEHEILATFETLSVDAQCLYVRLISRTGPWFRESRLQYPEIDGITPALDQLLEKDFAGEAAVLSVAEAGALLNFSELANAFAFALDGGKPATKRKYVEELESLDLTDEDVRSAVERVETSRIVTPRHLEFVTLLQLLFFGNRYQSLTEFVLDDLGVFKYYPYEVDRNWRQFPNRAALDEYLALAALSDDYRLAIEEGCFHKLPELADSVLAFDVEYESSMQRRDKLYNQLARELERSQCLELAGALYTQSETHPARERRARILERSGEWHSALTLCEEIQNAPWCEAEQEAAKRILPRLQRKLGIDGRARQRDAFAAVNLDIQVEDSPVELLAAAALEENWRSVHYVENSLFKTLFGLAFWEQIFQPVAGAFNHAYQAAPLDMYQHSFKLRRIDSIEKRLSELGNADLSETLTTAYQRYFPYKCHWVNWRKIDVEVVAAASRAIPAAHLLAIWRRMLFDTRENRKGFPDLIGMGENPGEYCLYEVKGPGDNLQDSQKRWLRYFQQQNIPARVAWVSWTS